VEARLRKARLNVSAIEQLRDEAYSVVGVPENLEYGDKVVGIVTAPDGRVLDMIRNVK